MHNDVQNRIGVTRRSLLRGATGLGLSALALGLPARLDAAGPWYRKPLLPVASYNAGLAIAWYRLALQLVQQTPGYSPPVASRTFGYLGVTLYEALVPGMSGFRSLGGLVNDLPEIPPLVAVDHHWPAVANSALAALARKLFATASDTNQAAITALESHFALIYARGLHAGIMRRSVGRGKDVAARIFEWSQADGGHEGYLHNFPAGYVPPEGPGLWVPTAPSRSSALQPYWGSNRPFILSSGAAFRPEPPPRFSTSPGSAFYAEAREVYEAVIDLTAEQRTIAHFWADDPGRTSTPPGHSISILTQVLEEREADLEQAARAYALVGMALADAFISCWDAKYTYNLIRPITYIEQHIDRRWGLDLPVETPPFPEYTSGHSVQTGAFVQVLFDLFGDFAFTDHTHDALGFAPRSFSSCFAMADEAAISRLYGGIHFRSAIVQGLAQGKQIGRRISALALRGE